MKKKISQKSLWIKIIISCFFFWILFSFVQADKLLKIFSNINWLYFALSISLIPIMLVISCLKWKMVLDLHEHKISFLQLLKLYLIGYLFSNLLPSTVGGDVVRSYYSGKILNNQSFSAIAIFIERFSGFFMLLLLVIIAPIMKADLYKSPYIYVPGMSAFVLMLIILWLWKVRKSLHVLNQAAHWTFSILHKLVQSQNLKRLAAVINLLEGKYINIHKRLQKLHDELTMAVLTIKKNRFLFARIALITFLFYLLTWLNVYVTFMAFDIKPDFLGICALVPTVLFVAQVPVTLLGNIGYFESVFVFYFLLIGIPGAETLAMGLLLRLKMLMNGLMGYLFYVSNSHIRYSDEEFQEIVPRGL